MKTKTIDNLKKMAFITFVLGFFLCFMELYLFIFIITRYAFINPESFIASICVTFGYGSMLYLSISIILYWILTSKDNNLLEE